MPVAEAYVRAFIFIGTKHLKQSFSRFAFNTNPRLKVGEHGTSGVSPKV